ncbi:LZTR1, partial [Symbiodinium necroappetens]
MLGLDARVQRLTKKIDEADLQFGVEGPCTPWSGECRFLKRKFTGINGNIVIEQDGKHVDKLVSLVGVERVFFFILVQTDQNASTRSRPSSNDGLVTLVLSEVHGSLYSLQEGLFLKRLLETVCSDNVLKHIDIAYLWVQDLRARNMFSLKPISTRFCPPDLATKPMSGVRSRMLSYLIGVCQSDGTLIGAEEFEGEWSTAQLRCIRNAQERSIAQSSSHAARRVLAILLASEGLNFAEGALCFSRYPNTPSMFTSWNLGIMVVVPLLLAVIFVNTEAFFKTYTKDGDHTQEETNVENIKVTRRLEETIEYYNNAEDTTFLENAFYILAFFTVEAENYWEIVVEMLFIYFNVAIKIYFNVAIQIYFSVVIQMYLKEMFIFFLNAMMFVETPQVVRQHRLYKANGVDYSEKLLRHWETHREVSTEALEEFEGAGTAAAVAAQEEFNNRAADPGAQGEEVWVVGRGSAFHKVSCGMVKKAQPQ